MSEQKRAIIIGAGPAGLTVALELLERTDYRVIVLEAADDVGGIARTYVYKNNHMDIGGHRFFSKSDRVMEWWSRILPLQGPQQQIAQSEDGAIEISYQNKSRWLELPADGPDPDQVDDVMLVRARTSRILFLGKLFDYPLSLSLSTLAKLGPLTTVKIGISYVWANLFPIRPEVTLRDFFINRFGRVLYGIFFRDYTEKVWGVPCEEISADWGAQRIKGLSLLGILSHAAKSLFRTSSSISQKDTETSLIEQFLYPKYGPGQIWQKVRGMVEAAGGDVRMETFVESLHLQDGRAVAVTVRGEDGTLERLEGELFFSSTNIRDLVAHLDPPAPPAVREVSDGLIYRDFITVGVLLKRLELGGGASGRDIAEKMPDNWIYIQEPGVKLGRLQIFNNWSPYLVADPDTVWLGLEYFCGEGDELWSKDDAEFATFAAAELEQIHIAKRADVLDSVVIRVPKTYPAYFGTYDRFDEIRQHLDPVENLYLIGRNGMHRYNNQDHSMLAAMTAVDNLLAGITDKENVWTVNTEAEYHEEK